MFFHSFSVIDNNVNNEDFDRQDRDPGDPMTRIRRSPEAARKHIIEAARRLLIAEGPRALKLQRVGKEAGMSHASVVHYFGSIEGLTKEVMKDSHRSLRESLRQDWLDAKTPAERAAHIDQALGSLSDRDQGRLTLSLLSCGLDPFPSPEELGLASIAELLTSSMDVPQEEAQNMVLAHVLIMLGEAMVGREMRTRLGVEDTEASRTEFRRWLMSRLR